MLVGEVRKQIGEAVGAAQKGSERVIEGANLVDAAKNQIADLSTRARRAQAQSDEIISALAAGRGQLAAVASHAEQTSSVAGAVGNATAEQLVRVRQIQAIAERVHELGVEVLKVTEAHRPASEVIATAANDVRATGT